MIELIFELGSEIILIVIKGKEVLFGNTTFGAQLADISGLRLNYAGVVREFPDLELNENWQQIAITRFKEKINNHKTEEETSDYLIEEFKKMGYTAKQKRRKGFRPQKI